MPSSADHPWMTLCASYSVSAEASVTALLLDANVLLDNAQGMAHTLSRNLRQSEVVDAERLASAIHGMALLIEMGRRCMTQAQMNMSLPPPSLTTGDMANDPSQAIPKRRPGTQQRAHSSAKRLR